MTQVLAAITPECAFLVADRRLTYAEGSRKGSVSSDVECKVVSLCHINAIGYTGLAKLDGIPTNEWIATTLAKAGCRFAGEASDVLRQAADAALASHPKRVRRQAFLMCGWAHCAPDGAVKPHLGLISNYHDDAAAPTPDASDKFTVRTRILRPGETVAAFAIGVLLERRRETELLRAIRRAIGRDNGHAAVLRLLAEEIFVTSTRAATVNDRVQACCIPRASAGSFFGGGAVRLSGLRARADGSTFSYFDREYNEHEQFGPTLVCGRQAFTEVLYNRSKTGPETSMSIRVLYAPDKES